MLLERNQAIVGFVFAVLLVVGTVVGIAFDRSWITGGVVVTAYFEDAAGLQTGDTVMIAGVRSGQVESVELDEQRGIVRTRLRVEEPMPSDSRARIALQNFLGKRVVMLDAGEGWDDLFESDDEIPLERTSTPVDYAELNQESVDLLRGSDVEALATLVSSVADVTEGQEEEVAQLLEGLQRITQVIADRRDELGRAIDRSEDVFAVLADEDQEIVTIIDEFGSTLDVLARRRDDITRLLAETADASHAVADLVSTDREQLDRTLRELHEALEVVDAHQVDLAHVFAYGGASFEGYANIAMSGERDNPYWGNVFVQNLGSAGVDPLLGCGGVVDDALDQIFGEDTRSCEDVDGGSGAEEEDPTGAPTGSLRSFFRVPTGGVR